MDKVITARDIAKRDGCQSHKEWLLKKSAQMKRRNQLDTPFTGEMKHTAAAVAEIDFGRWIARCPDCGGVEYVNYDEKVFYCFGCGNYSIGGAGRPVKFPNARERRKIEKDVMARKVIKRKGINAIQRELMAEAVDEPRCWKPENKESE